MYSLVKYPFLKHNPSNKETTLVHFLPAAKRTGLWTANVTRRRRHLSTEGTSIEIWPYCYNMILLGMKK